MEPRPLPAVPEEDSWVLDGLDEMFAASKREPSDMRARAQELRAYAAGQDVAHGGVDAALALAERWEAAAAARIAAR